VWDNPVVIEKRKIMTCLKAQQIFQPIGMLGLRVSMSAPVGDPDPYPQVYRFSKLKLRSI
jgi:hypothetical protein